MTEWSNINTRPLTWPISISKIGLLVLRVWYKVEIGLKTCGLAIRSFCDIKKLNWSKRNQENYKSLNVFSVINNFLRKYCATFTTEYAGGCSIIWMITQELPFVMTLTGSQTETETETTHSQQRRTSGQLVTGPCQLACVFKKVGSGTTVKADWIACESDTTWKYW